MKLLYSIPAAQLASEQERIRAEILGLIPEAVLAFDCEAGRLCIELPPNAAPEIAAETLQLCFARLGVQAERVQSAAFSGGQGSSWHTPTHEERFEGGAGAPQTPQAPPPVMPHVFAEKKPRTVKLSVFVISLIAVTLTVSVLMFSLASLMVGGSPFLLGNDGALGTGDQKGEDFAGKIALIDYIFENYSLYDTDGQLLLDEMLKAYAAATGDEYAAYYTQEEMEALKTQMESGAVGVGVTVTMDSATGNILVIQVAPDSPAQSAGVRPGDIIVRIGTRAAGENVSDIGYELAMQKLLGSAGTVAEFVVLREGAELEFAITRAPFTVVSAEGRVSATDPKVGIIRLTGFEAKTPTQFKNAMNALLEAGCERFVFDVRNNPGGEQKSVTAILSYFLNEKDTVLSVVSKDGTTTYYRAEAASYTGEYADCSIKKEEIGMYRQYKSVVLTNGYTASAAELFTAALADYQLTTVVGDTTFGKGVIQSIYDLSAMGYSGGLKLTVGYYAPPSGVNYDGVGIVPHLPVALDPTVQNQNLYLLNEAQDNQLSAAIATVLSK